MFLAMSEKYKKLLLLMIFFSASALGAVADLIVFSKNRPLQLYAFLESVQRYVAGISSTTVIYNATDEHFAAGYRQVQRDFPQVNFAHQLGRQDFKQTTFQAIATGSASYLIFAVDDIVVIDTVDLTLCARLLEKYKAYGFYLRLGSDITHCYMTNQPSPVPPLKKRDSGSYQWCFEKGTGDWNYPNTVDMTLYRKSDVKQLMTTLQYTTPNTLEAGWASKADPKKFGLCFETSKIVNMPLNITQNDYSNRHAGSFDPIILLAKFNEGFKIDINALHRLPHTAPHVDCTPVFILR